MTLNTSGKEQAATAVFFFVRTNHMIDLEFLKSDDFYVGSGLAYFGSTTNASHLVSQHPRIEQAKRFLVEDDFPQIDKR